MTGALPREITPPTSPVAGRCPMGCPPNTLRLDLWGAIACEHPTCPRPGAARELLDIGDTGHVLEIAGGGVAPLLTHPLSERLADLVLSCPMQATRHDLNLSLRPGRYRVEVDGRGHHDYRRLPA